MANDGATAPPADLMPVVPGYENLGPNGENNFGSFIWNREQNVGNEPDSGFVITSTVIPPSDFGSAQPQAPSSAPERRFE